MRIETMIAVRDVEASSRWYQELLGVRSDHGGKEFERLVGPDGVVRVFFVQGAMIGWAGVLIGVLLGVVLALNVPVIVPFLEQSIGFQIMPGDVYYVTRIPSELEWPDVWVIGVAAFILTSLATLYPARRAALVNPAVALRYE